MPSWNVQGEGGPPLLVCKGAVEETLALCSCAEAGEESLPLEERHAACGYVQIHPVSTA